MKTLKTVVRLILRFLYGFRVFGAEALSTPGPVLLIPNHVSWLDWLFLGACLDEDWRFVTSSVTAQSSWLHRKIMVNRYTFPIDMASPYSVRQIADFLQQGGRLVLFAEGRISLTGNLMKLFQGTALLLHKTDAKVITCYLRGANRIPFVRHSGWTRWFHRVTVHFSKPLTPPTLKHVSTAVARERLTLWLYDRLVEQQFETESTFGPATVLGAIRHTAARLPGKVILEDISRQELTYTKLMVGTRLLAQQWTRLFPAHEERIGVLLPNVNATAVAVLSLWAARKVPAVLNYTTGTSIMLSCVQLAGLKSIITSTSFLERAKLDLEPFKQAGLKVIHLEEIRGNISGWMKLGALLRQRFAPQSGWSDPDPESSGVILFTSGSEGVPKGVDLSHSNLLANIRQMLAVIDVTDDDRMFNALPLFHSFGLTVGTFLPLVRGLYTFLYLSPLHYRVVPAAVYDRACTIMLGTNTFLNGYARKAHPYDFRSIRYLFAAAEKLQDSTARTWAQKFGIRVLEGYGATECSPCLTVNTPMSPKYGSAGRFLPKVEFKLQPIEGVHDGGRLLVRGPNIMRGYLNPDANAQFKSLGGWYDTGDIVRVDEEGHVFIQGRLKRFAKVSGEMVSLTAVENALAGAFPHYGLRCIVAVISRPDEDKGEALVAVTNEPKLRLEEIRAAIKAQGLTNLAVPRELKVVRDIPTLGTGKVNYRELSKILEATEAERVEEGKTPVH